MIIAGIVFWVLAALCFVGIVVNIVLLIGYKIPQHKLDPYFFACLGGLVVTMITAMLFTSLGAEDDGPECDSLTGIVIEVEGDDYCVSRDALAELIEVEG